MAEELNKYLEKLKVWGLMVLAVLLLSIANALANRWLGKENVQPLPPPPVVVVQPDPWGENPPTVNVIHPKP